MRHSDFGNQNKKQVLVPHITRRSKHAVSWAREKLTWSHLLSRLGKESHMWSCMKPVNSLLVNVTTHIYKACY